jgi:ABC-type iron transport system FetAB ATPase subunit
MAGIGWLAPVLPQICDVWLKARDAEALRGIAQATIAAKADILMRGLAHTGIIALVDEATGYKDVRDRRALQQILDSYVGK